MLSTSILLLSGCGLIDDAIKDLEGLTNPLVGQAFFLGVAEPDDTTIAQALADSEIGLERIIQVHLADAASVDDLTEAPISGAVVDLEVGSSGAVDLEEVMDGGYKASAADGLTYVTGQDANLSIMLGEDVSTMSISLPAAVEAVVSSDWDSNTEMVVSLGGEYDGALGVVLDVAAAEVTWDNRPSGIQEIYDFTHGDAVVTELVIPASAFPGPSLYAVGIAGVDNADPETFENVNTLLTSFVAGKVRFYAVNTIPIP